MVTVKMGVSLPSELVDELDRLVKELNMPSRSYVLTRAVTNYISERAWLKSEEGTLAGAISVLYDHTRHELSDKLTDLQHYFIDIIKSTVHVHIDEKRCLEVILVQGKVKRIRELARSLESQRGLIYIRYTLVKI